MLFIIAAAVQFSACTLHTYCKSIVTNIYVCAPSCWLRCRIAIHLKKEKTTYLQWYSWPFFVMFSSSFHFVHFIAFMNGIETIWNRTNCVFTFTMVSIGGINTSETELNAIYRFCYSFLFAFLSNYGQKPYGRVWNRFDRFSSILFLSDDEIVFGVACRLSVVQSVLGT